MDTGVQPIGCKRASAMVPRTVDLHTTGIPPAGAVVLWTANYGGEFELDVDGDTEKKKPDRRALRHRHREAVKAFQASLDDPMDGQLSPKQWARLGISSGLFVAVA